MIKFVLLLSVFVSLAIPLSLTQAQLVSPLQYISENCNPETVRITTQAATGLQTCLQTVYNFLVAIAVAIAFIYIIYGALEYLVGAATNKQEAGKDKIKNALIGLLIIFVSGVVLYQVNPNIFNAQLIIYRVATLTPPILGESGKGSFPSGTQLSGNPAPKVTGPEETVPPEAGLPPGTKGRFQRFNNVKVTHYYTPLESQDKFEKGDFASEVQMEGSGKCEKKGKIPICKNYYGYINKDFKQIPAPSDSCGFKTKAMTTIAVPPQWWPSVVKVYLKGGNSYGTFWGTDRGSGVNDMHIDIYVGEGLNAYKDAASLPSVDVEVYKLQKCSQFKSH
jgi:3D (Asp-Asp-Asp) domain-containing protein